MKGAGSVKPQHVQDAAFQYYVITHCGIMLDDISIVHVNSKYIRKGELDIQQLFKTTMIGIEIVAYQMSLMHFLNAEMRKRKQTIPVHGLRRGNDKSKNQRIRGLVPRFEWNRIFIKPGLHDFEDEYMKFPRGTFVDILDALSSIEEIAYPPEREKLNDKQPAPNHPDYESWYIRNKLAQKARETQGMEEG